MSKNKLENFFDGLNKKLFLFGKKQHDEEAKKIVELSSDKLNYDEALSILLGTSALFSIAEDKSDDRMLGYINKKANQKLSFEETKKVLDFIASKFHCSYSSDSLQLLIDKAKELKQKGEFQEALDCYNEVFDLLVREANEKARNCEGTVVDKGETRTILPKFFEEAKKYLKQDKTVAVVSNNMGVIFAELGDLGNARKMFEQAVDLTPDRIEYKDPETNLRELEE